MKLIHSLFAITATCVPLIGATDVAQCDEHECRISRTDWDTFLAYHKKTLEWAAQGRELDRENGQAIQGLQSNLESCIAALKRYKA